MVVVVVVGGREGGREGGGGGGKNNRKLVPIESMKLILYPTLVNYHQMKYN